VVAALSANAIDSGTARLALQLSLVGGLGVLSCILSVMAFGRRLTAPLQELIEAVRRHALGERVLAPSHFGPDELGELQRAYADMSQKVIAAVSKQAAPEDGGSFRLVVSDDGVGWSQANCAPGRTGGLGRRLIDALARQLGASLGWGKTEGGGARVVVEDRPAANGAPDPDVALPGRCRLTPDPSHAVPETWRLTSDPPPGRTVVDCDRDESVDPE
jgi:nitrate/nitrite-specific signal transduction histidine kinase